MNTEKAFEKFHRNNVLLALLAIAVFFFHFEVRAWIFERDTHRYVINTLSILDSAQRGNAGELLDADKVYPFLHGQIGNDTMGGIDRYYEKASEYASSILTGRKAIPVFFDLSFSLNGCQALIVPRPDEVKKFLGNGETFEGLEYEVMQEVGCELTSQHLPASIVFDVQGNAKLIGFRDEVAWEISPLSNYFGCNFATLDDVLSPCREVETIPYRSWGPVISGSALPDAPQHPVTLEFEVRELPKVETRGYLPTEILLTRLQLLGAEIENFDGLSDMARSAETLLGDNSPTDQAELFGYKTARQYIPSIAALVMLYYCANLWLIARALKKTEFAAPEVPNFYFGNGRPGAIFTFIFAMMPLASVVAVAVIALDTFRLTVGGLLYINPLELRLDFGKSAVSDAPIWSDFPRFVPEGTVLILTICLFMNCQTAIRTLYFTRRARPNLLTSDQN